MRWPIQVQLLAPMLTVVVLAIVLASLGSAYIGGLRARRAQEESLGRVVDTLTEAWFPLNEAVLRQMGGLSGAEFVLFDWRDAVQASTMPVGDDDKKILRAIDDRAPTGDLAARPAVSLGGKSYLSQRVSVPARDTLSQPRSLIVLYPEDRWSAVMHQAAYPALTAGALAAAAIVLVAAFLSHRLVQPIRRLGERAAEIAQGNFNQVAFSRHDDEIRDLEISINRMAEQLGHYEGQVRRHEQLRTLDRLGAGMAHQLRNAATGGRMAIELHQRECPAGHESESIEVALRQLRLMESYLQRFMSLGRERPLASEIISLSQTVADALLLVRPACVHAGIDLKFCPPPVDLHIAGDAEALRQLIVNLAINAVEAVGKIPGSRPNITVAVEMLPSGRAALHVKDTGPGPVADVAEHLFEPFVTGKPEGTGLGLYVARQIAEGHNGSIRWQRENDTTCFTLEIPLAPIPSP